MTRVIFQFDPHAVREVRVLIECECGDTFEAYDEDQARRDWEVHYQTERGEEPWREANEPKVPRPLTRPGHHERRNNLDERTCFRSQTESSNSD